VGEGLRLHGLGAVVEVRCTGAAGDALEAAMRVAWSRCLVTSEVSPVQAQPIEVRLDDPAELPLRMMLTTQRVTRSLIGARVGELLMFHAGAVSHPMTGRSLVYVAAGGTGKTTLSRLLGQGLGYLTDETVGIDASGEIHPYPKPLSVRRTSDPRIKDELSPDHLGLLTAPARPTVSRLVLLDRNPAETGTVLEELSVMDAIFSLVEQSSSLTALPRPLHRMAELIDSTSAVIRVRYHDAAETSRELIELIDAVT
jgi:hypothetical protein